MMESMSRDREGNNKMLDYIEKNYGVSPLAWGEIHNHIIAMKTQSLV
jgi:hypothetical protein